nr:integrase arm-type DNA-binding domain-containing protein [Sphingopyxis witflariensis]
MSYGDGLMRLDRPGGASSWVCRVQKHGNRRDFGLGSCQKVSLAQARELAREIRSQIALGIDPQFERRKRQAVPNFKEAAARVYEVHSKTWRNGKHHAQWTRTLELYAFPHIGKFRVDQITGPMIRDLLEEIWLDKPETARRVRQRVGAVLDWAYASGYRDTEAPMRAITKGLPRQPRRDNHFAAMPYEDVPAFIQTLRERESFSRLALEFAIFTAARSGEVRGATWDEFDLEKGLWKLSKGRMKAFREHVVPLSRRPLRIVQRCARLRIAGCELVFPGIRRNRPLSDMTLSKLVILGGTARMEQVAIFGDGKEDQAVNAAKQFFEQGLHRHSARLQSVAHLRVCLHQTLSKLFERGGDIGVEILSRLDALLESGLAPLLKRTVGYGCALSTKAGGVGEKPECGEVCKHLVAEHGAQVSLDPRGAREAAIVTHQARAVAGKDEAPKGMIGAVQPILQKRHRASASPSAFRVPELRLRFRESVGVRNRRGGDNWDAPRLGLPGNPIVPIAVAMFDGADQIGEAETLREEIVRK